jgi:hypothetical protein
MSRNFRFQQASDFDNPISIWHVTHKRTNLYVGEVRLEQAGNYSVRRPSEASFHDSLATKVQAARWLKRALGSSVNFEDDIEPTGDEEGDD